MSTATAVVVACSIMLADTDLLVNCPADMAGAAYWARPGTDGSPGGVAHGLEGYVGAAALNPPLRFLEGLQGPQHIRGARLQEPLLPGLKAPSLV